MTEMEILKALFKAFSTKETIFLNLIDGHQHTGVVCSFDGEKITLDEKEIAVSTIVDIGKNENTVDLYATSKKESSFVKALLAGARDQVEEYFANPDLLLAEGFSERDVETICSKKNKPLPWEDNEQNIIYNQARRIYDILGTREGLAQNLFERFISTSTSPKLIKKAIGSLQIIYCVEAPERLYSFWNTYKSIIAQEPVWVHKLAQAFIRAKDFSLLRDLIECLPSDFNLREIEFVTNYMKRYGTYSLVPNEFETILIAGDIPRLRLIASDADVLTGLGYSADEIKHIQEELKRSTSFATHDDWAIAKRLYSFQQNKNGASEFYYVMAMQSGKKLAIVAQGLFDLYLFEKRYPEACSVFEYYLTSNWTHYTVNVGPLYVSSLIQCEEYQKALDFWKENTEHLNLDNIVLLYLFLKNDMSDEDIQQLVGQPISITSANIDLAKRVLCLLAAETSSEIYDIWLANIYNASFAFLDRDFIAEFKGILINSNHRGLVTTAGAGVSALTKGFSEEVTLTEWFHAIAPLYNFGNLADVVRNIISIYVNGNLVCHSDVCDAVRYIQKVGEDIPRDLLQYLRPQFTTPTERENWLEQCIADVENIDEATFELFFQTIDEAKDSEKLCRFICGMARRTVPYAQEIIERATLALADALYAESNMRTANELINAICTMATRERLATATLVVLFRGFLFTEQNNYAFIIGSILQQNSGDLNTQEEICETMSSHPALKDLTLYGVVADELANESLYSVHRLVDTWGAYFHITENDSLQLREIRDYYDAPEKWSSEAKDALAKHLLADNNSALYWQLVAISHRDSDEPIRINIQFHRAIAEKVSVSASLENAVRNGLSTYAIEILHFVLAKSDPDAFARLSELIVRLVNKHPTLLSSESAKTLLIALVENTALRSDLQAWERVLDLAMEIAFVGDAVDSFAELFFQHLASYPESNSRFLCYLLLRKPESTELILSSFEKVKTVAQKSPLVRIVGDILSTTEQGALSDIQRDVLRIITQCRKSIDEKTLYNYYVSSITTVEITHILAVLNHFEQCVPNLRVFDDVKKYEALRVDACDDDVLALYEDEYSSLKELGKPDRIAKVITNLIPGELYLKAKGYEIKSAFDLGKKVLRGTFQQEIIRRKDALLSLEKVFPSEKYPGFVWAFMKSCFTRQWKQLILCDVSNKLINDILKNDPTVKNLLFKKSYEVLKSGILAILDSNTDNEDLIDRVDAIFASCGGIRRSKNYLRRIQKLDDEDRVALRKVFTVRIESKTLRKLGVAGSAILNIPGNEKVAYLVGMLESRSLTELFDNNECLNTLALMPKETAMAIAEIYATFFYHSADNLFKRYLQNQTEDYTMIEFSVDSDDNDKDTRDACKPFRIKYLRAKEVYDAQGISVPRSAEKAFELSKAAYLHRIVLEANRSELETLQPSPMDYLSVITWLFNKHSVDAIQEFVWKLDSAIFMPCLSHVMTLLAQYPLAFVIADRVLDEEWKIASLQVLYRTVSFKPSCDEDREIAKNLTFRLPHTDTYFLGKFYPTNDQQRPLYVEKMQSLYSFVDEFLKYMSFNGIDVSWVAMDNDRFAKHIAWYTNDSIPAEEYSLPVRATQESSHHDAIVSIMNTPYLTGLMSGAKATSAVETAIDAVPTIEDCICALKRLAGKNNDATSSADVYAARNWVRWIYLLKMEDSEFSREMFAQVLDLISSEDLVYRAQWNYIIMVLHQYFECIDSLQHLARITESDIAGLRNIGEIRNPQVRILRKADVDEWNIIVDVLSNIAGIDFSRTAESEQALRLIGCRTKLVSNIEKKASSVFDLISNKLLVLINGQIAVLRHAPELSISVLGEDENGTQTILWEAENQRGKLYAIVSNIGGADCKQVSLISSINSMKRIKESWINAVYVGEKIPVEQSFKAEDLVDGIVTWDIELSYYDNEKDKTIRVAHRTTATIRSSEETLDRGHISTGNPARGKNFVGRTRELALLRNYLSDTSEVPSLLIRGLRRSGKSSILLRLADELQKKNQLLVIPVDGQSIGISGSIKNAFIDKVLDSIRMNYRNHPDYADIVRTRFAEFAKEWKGFTGSQDWIGQLDMFYYELSQMFSRKLLILIDEMESIFYSNRFTSAPEEEALYAALRSLIQNRENYVSFIFCGSDKLLTSCLEQRRESQMFQTLQFLEVGRMSRPDIREIFRLESEKSDIRFTPDAVDAIWEYTHGLVWYAKLLGYIVINNILENDLTIRGDINRCDIVNAVQMLINGEIGTDKYDLVDASLNTIRSAIVRAMAGIMPDFNKEVSVDEISMALKLLHIEAYADPRTGELVPIMNENSIKQHLAFLEKMQLIVANASKTKYSFAAELYRLFFRKEKKLHVFEERVVKQ